MSEAAIRPIRLFLDANILVSAAWKDNSSLLRLWQIPNAELLTSGYVLAESRRNLPTPDQQERLDRLIASVQILQFSETIVWPEAFELPPKDRPVLAAAILAKADILITGDKQHFGKWFGSSILGVRIEPPAAIPHELQSHFPHLNL